MGSTMSGQPLPADRWAAVAVPALVMYGRDTEPWLIAAARALAALLPTASLQAVEGPSTTSKPTCSRPSSGGSRRPSRPPGVDWTHFYAIKWAG